MLNVVKEKLELSPDLRKKINWASKYTSTSISLEKITLIKLEPTNIDYVDPHKIIIKDIKFLFFNGIDCLLLISFLKTRFILNFDLDIQIKILKKLLHLFYSNLIKFSKPFLFFTLP